MDYEVEKRPYEISIWGKRSEASYLIGDDLYTNFLVKYINSDNTWYIEKVVKEEESSNREGKSEDQIRLLEHQPYLVIKEDPYWTYFNEDKIAIIGAEDMDAPSRAMDAKFLKKVNGEKQLTFTMYSRYWDERQQDFVDNPFVKLLCNERVVKLRYGKDEDGKDKWYDFLIKDIKEDSAKHSYTYTCKDRFANELGKNGFNIELKKELENNQGTVFDLARSICEGTDWYVDEKNSDEIRQYKIEPLYGGILNQDIIVRSIENNDYINHQIDLVLSKKDALEGQEYEGTPLQMKAEFSAYLEAIDRDNTYQDWINSQSFRKIPNSFGDVFDQIDDFIRDTYNGEKIYAGNTIYMFYSQLAAQEKEIGLIYSPYGYKTDDNRIILEDNYGNKIKNYTIKNVEYKTEEDWEGQLVNSRTMTPTFIKDFVFLSEKYRGKRLVKTQSSGYDKLLERYYNQYNITENVDGVPLTKVYNCYTKSLYNAPELLTNLIVSGEQFNNYSSGIPTGWRNTNNGIKISTGFVQAWGGTGDVYAEGKFDWDKIWDAYNWENERKISEALDFLPVLKIDSQDAGGYDSQYIINSSFSSNKQSIDEISEGDSFIIRIKGGVYSDYGRSYYVEEDKYKFSFFVREYEMDGYYKPKETPEYCNFSFWKYDEESGYLYYKGSFNQSVSYNDLKNKRIGLVVKFWHTQAFIEKIQLFRERYDGEGNLITLEDYTPTAQAQVQYCFYDPEEVKLQKIDDIDNFVPRWTVTAIDDLKKYGVIDVQPNYDNGFRKVRSIEGAESNRFNLLQDLCETFECWIDFKVKHDDYGALARDPVTRALDKRIIFKEYIGKDNYAGFRYGINLKSISRQLDSKDLTTKLIVKDNSNEFGKNGFCSIARASENPTKENFIFNFDHYVRMGLIDSVELSNDLYGHVGNMYDAITKEGKEVKTKRICYYERLEELNQDRDQKIDELLAVNAALTAAMADQQTYQLAKDADEQELQEIRDTFGANGTGITFDDFMCCAYYLSPTRDERGNPPIDSSYDITSEPEANKIRGHYKVSERKTEWREEASDAYGRIDDISAMEEIAELGFTKIQTNIIYITASSLNFQAKLATDEEWDAFAQAVKTKLDIGDQLTTNLINTLKNNEEKFDNFVQSKDKKVVYLFTLIRDNYAKNQIRQALILQSNRAHYEQLLGPEEQPTEEGYIGLNGEVAKLKKQAEDIDNYLETLRQKKEKLNQEFFNKYFDFIQEGSWNSEDYYDDNLYYLDAENVCYTSAHPKVTYNISVMDVSAINYLKYYAADVGDKTYIEDTDFFGWVEDEDGIKTPYKEEIIISEITRNLEQPSKDQIKVQNYKTQFEDLFQRIAATSQSLQYHEGEYARSATILSTEGQIKETYLRDALDGTTIDFSNAISKVEITEDDGILVSDKSGSGKQVRIVGTGIQLYSGEKDSWDTAITGKGINANYIKTGALDTNLIKIWDGANQAFRWDQNGITAFYSDENGYDANKFTRFDKYGFYGYNKPSAVKGNSFDSPWVPSNLNDIQQEADFGFTWNGFFINGGNSDGANFSIDNTGIHYFTKISENEKRELMLQTPNGLSFKGYDSSGNVANEIDISSLGIGLTGSINFIQNNSSYGTIKYKINASFPDYYNGAAPLQDVSVLSLSNNVGEGYNPALMMGAALTEVSGTSVISLTPNFNGSNEIGLQLYNRGSNNNEYYPSFAIGDKREGSTTLYGSCFGMVKEDGTTAAITDSGAQGYLRLGWFSNNTEGENSQNAAITIGTRIKDDIVTRGLFFYVTDENGISSRLTLTGTQIWLRVNDFTYLGTPVNYGENQEQLIFVRSKT